MINNKSFNRVIAESLFNLANNNQTVISQTPGLDKDIFSATFDTVDSTIPEAQTFVGDGSTTEYTLNGMVDIPGYVPHVHNKHVHARRMHNIHLAWYGLYIYLFAVS